MIWLEAVIIWFLWTIALASLHLYIRSQRRLKATSKISNVEWLGVNGYTLPGTQPRQELPKAQGRRQLMLPPDKGANAPF